MKREKPSNKRWFLVDDHPVILRGLSPLLAGEGWKLEGSASSQAEALERLPARQVEVVLLDLSLEQGSGMELLAWLHAERPDLPAIVYSVHQDSSWVRRALSAGARGYVTKSEDPEVLLQCLEEVGAGGTFLSPRARQGLASGPAEFVAPEQVLSPQELQIYRLTGDGYTASDIAKLLDLAVRTVDSYYGRILVKLGLISRRDLRIQAVAAARRQSQGLER
jgi:two-component system invasion response regulator UvrY